MTLIGSKVDPMVLHFREYRDRMHGGRNPQYMTLFNPLGSKILDEVSEVSGSRRFKVGQVNYDIMSNLLPEILEIPFDSDLKALTEEKTAHWLTDGGIEDEWDDYVSAMDSMGLQDVVAAWQAAYDRYVEAQ